MCFQFLHVFVIHKKSPFTLLVLLYIILCHDEMHNRKTFNLNVFEIISKGQKENPAIYESKKQGSINANILIDEKAILQLCMHLYLTYIHVLHHRYIE